MRTGTGADQSFLSVDWSKVRVHDGPFNLLFYSAQHELLSDQGYLNNVTAANTWMASAEAHNTALVRASDGGPERCITWLGDLRFFVDTPSVKAVEVAEQNPKRLQEGLRPGERAFFQRTVLLLELGNAAAPSSSYAVDIFRLQSGALHDYYIHSLGDEFALAGAELKPVGDEALTLHKVSGFTYKTDTGANVITNIRRASTDASFVATWRGIKDWSSAPAAMDKETECRVRFLDAPGTEVLVGTSIGQRYIDARDITQRLTVLCVRRKSEAYREVPDAFVAVVDGHRGDRDGVRQIERLAVVAGDKAAVGVQVTYDGGVDYVLSATQDDTETTFAAPGEQRKLVLVGRLGVVRVPTGKPPALLLLRGARLSDGTTTATQPVGETQ
jgi:hypothetical protein